MVRRVFRRVPDFLCGGAVLVLDSAPSLLEPGEEGIDMGDVALVESQLAELAEDQAVEPVPVGIRGGVLPTFGDLHHPHGRGLTKSGMRSQ